MAQWIMTSQKKNSEYHFFIGQVKIAEVCFRKAPTKWRVYVRYFGGSEVAEFDSMSDALKDMHKRLQSPPVEKV